MGRDLSDKETEDIIDLREKMKTSHSTKLFLSNLRLIVPKLSEDRPLGGDIEKTASVLDQLSQS